MGERSAWEQQIDATVVEYELRLQEQATIIAQWGDRLAALERQTAALGKQVAALDARLDLLERGREGGR